MDGRDLNRGRNRPYDNYLSVADRMQIDRLRTEELRRRHRGLGPGRQRDYIADVLARRAVQEAPEGDLRAERAQARHDDLRRLNQLSSSRLPVNRLTYDDYVERNRLQRQFNDRLRAERDRLAAERDRARRAAEAIVVAAAAMEAAEAAARARRNRRHFTGGMVTPVRPAPRRRRRELDDTIERYRGDLVDVEGGDMNIDRRSDDDDDGPPRSFNV